MPTPGLSLVGFMDQQQAINHLKIACKPMSMTDAALLAEWQAAVAKRGAPIANAGNPEIKDIPPEHATHIQQLQALPWAVNAAQPPNGPLLGATYKLVQIDPLLAYQQVVDLDHVNRQCGGLSSPPKLEELLLLCLPHAKPNGEFHHQVLDRSLIIKSRSLNLRYIAGGIGPEDPNTPIRLAGINFGWALQLAHVVRFNGRCYLHNGYHRAVGAKLAGATHIPCVFRDVPTQQMAEIKEDGSTFYLGQLEAADPPTIGHFNPERAHQVQLRITTRILHLSWAEYGIYDE